MSLSNLGGREKKQIASRAWQIQCMILAMACPGISLFVPLNELRAMMVDCANMIAWIRGASVPMFPFHETFDPEIVREKLIVYMTRVPRDVALGVLSAWKNQEKNELFSQLKPEDRTCWTIALDTLVDEVKTRQNASN